MIEPSLQLGGGNWANKSDSLLGYHKDGANFYADELTFSRNSLGSYTDANGLIQSMPYNLITYSEQFDNAAWNKTRSSITTNATTAPNGTLTADKLIDDTTASATHQIREGVSVSGGEYTMSIYAKKGEYNFIRFWEDGISGKQCYFDLENGVATNVNMTSVNIVNVGNGWFRCEAKLTISSGTFGFRINLTPNGTTTAYNGTGTNGVYLWGAMLEQSPLATEYFPTTTRLNLARVDYKDNVNGSLLLEPQRANLALRSEEFDNVAWTKTAGVTITVNAAISPSGVMDADYIQMGAANRIVNQSTSLSIGVSCSASFYIKGTTGETIKLSAGGVDSPSITLTGDWQRIAHTATSTTNSININTFGGVTARNFFLWGAQLEAGNYVSSYIPTTTTAVTRVADSASKTGLQSSGIFGSTQGTIFLDIKFEEINYLLDFKNNVGVGKLRIFNDTNVSWRIRDLDGAAWYFTNFVINDNDSFKIALRLNGTTLTAFQNGVKASSDYTIALSLSIDQLIDFKFNKIQSMMLFPTALSDAEIIALTTI